MRKQNLRTIEGIYVTLYKFLSLCETPPPPTPLDSALCSQGWPQICPVYKYGLKLLILLSVSSRLES